jgi:hypothetical protein
MIAESNFIAKASFPVKSKNVELETESVPVAENQLNLKNINLFVDKVIDHNASEIIDTENRVLGSNMISSDNQIVVDEIEIQKNFNTAELNEVAVFEKLMEQELNVRINILKSIDAFIAAHSNKTREIVVNAEIKNKVVLSQTREVVDESETYIQSAFIETFDPHKVQVSQIEDIEKKNNSLDDKRDKGIDKQENEGQENEENGIDVGEKRENDVEKEREGEKGEEDVEKERESNFSLDINSTDTNVNLAKIASMNTESSKISTESEPA